MQSTDVQQASTVDGEAPASGGFDLVAEVRGVWDDAVQIWLDGGTAMVAIAVIALCMFTLGVHVYFSLRAKGFRSVPERTWRHWIEYPEAREGPIGQLLDFVTGGRSAKETSFFFRQMRMNELPPFERELKVMRICVSAAPLVGLLGTVNGMLSTFGALSGGAQGDKTMALVAAGISEALITTETGLVVALPGLFFQYQLTRMFDSYKAFLAHVETVCTQTLHRRDGASDDRDAKREALKVIARRLADQADAAGSAQGRSEADRAAEQGALEAVAVGPPSLTTTGATTPPEPMREGGSASDAGSSNPS